MRLVEKSGKKNFHAALAPLTLPIRATGSADEFRTGIK